jgi:hypothetical protein
MLLPVFSPSTGGKWELYASTVDNYPTGLQEGDVGIVLESDYRTSLSTPAKAASVDLLYHTQVREESAFDGKTTTTNYYRAFGRVSYKVLSPSDNGTPIGGGFAVKRVLVFRCTTPIPNPVVRTLGSQSASDVYDATTDISAWPKPCLPLLASMKLDDDGSIAAFSATVDGQAAVGSLASNSDRTRVMINHMEGVESSVHFTTTSAPCDKTRHLLILIGA